MAERKGRMIIRRFKLPCQVAGTNVIAQVDAIVSARNPVPLHGQNTFTSKLCPDCIHRNTSGFENPNRVQTVGDTGVFGEGGGMEVILCRDAKAVVDTTKRREH